VIDEYTFFLVRQFDWSTNVEAGAACREQRTPILKLTL
jgi:hypothetical protein